MIKAIDVADLPEEQAQLVKEFVEFLKARVSRNGPAVSPDTEEQEERIRFSSWPLGVKSPLTREEIYDFL